MNCWTLQHAAFLNQPTDRLVCRRQSAPPGWSHAYRWMRTAYRDRRGPMRHYPIWLWQERLRRANWKKRYEDIVLLDSAFELMTPKVIVDVEIPDAIALPSMYGKWNTLLEYCVSFRRQPNDPRDWKSMFDTRIVKAYDSVQVVVPWIERQWIRRVTPLDPAKLKAHGAWTIEEARSAPARAAQA